MYDAMPNMFQFGVVPALVSLTVRWGIVLITAGLNKWASEDFRLKYKIGSRTGKVEPSRWAYNTIILRSELLLLVSALFGSFFLPLLLSETSAHVLAWDLANATSSLTILCMRLLACLFLHDIWNYLCHRAMHALPWAYARWHAVHHEIVAPSTGWDAIYAHPVDCLLTGIGVSLALYVVRPDYSTALLFFALQSAQDTGNHTGWDLPFTPFALLPGHTTVAFHARHHAWGGRAGSRVRNFAGAFWVLDYLGGTLVCDGKR